MYEAKLAHIQPDTVPARPGEGRMIRRFLFNVTTSPNWAIVMALLIGANVVVRFLYGSEWLHYREGPTWIHIQEVGNRQHENDYGILVQAPKLALRWWYWESRETSEGGMIIRQGIRCDL